MEKILRKVKVQDRVPEKYKRYFCVAHSGSPMILEFDCSSNSWFTVMGDRVSIPAYWYEEVDVMDIVNDNIIDVCSEENIKSYERVINKLSYHLAKERYEKALGSLKNQEICVEDSTITYMINDLLKALKIAAGLKLEE